MMLTTAMETAGAVFLETTKPAGRNLGTLVVSSAIAPSGANADATVSFVSCDKKVNKVIFIVECNQLVYHNFVTDCLEYNTFCSCGHGYYGDQCQWTMCEDSCSMDTSCYQHSRSGLKYCCHDNAQGNNPL